MVLCGIFFAANLSAQDLTGRRVFIDPGHDGFGSGDRWQPTIPYHNQEHAGFWESRVNLVKAFALREFLQDAGATVGLSRTTQVGVGTDFDMISVAARAQAANAFNAHAFISIHSDATGNLPNHIVILHHGTDAAPRNPVCRIFGNHLFDRMIENQVTVWGAHNTGGRNVRGDWSFFNNTLGLGVLRNLNSTIAGILSEGSFHSYGPERHRLLSATYARMEAYNIFRGMCTFFAAEYGSNSTLNTFTTGAIIGWVKDNTRRMSQPGIHPSVVHFLPYRCEANQNPSSTLNDAWVPINGATIELLNMAGDVLQTYTVDNYWNGIFGFFNLPIGQYQLRMSADGFQTRTSTVNVTAGGLANAKYFLAPDVPPLQLVLGTSANAPHTPLLQAPHTMSVGDIAFLGVQEQGSTDWLHRLDLTLTSSNTNAATIAADGTVRAVGIGTTDIRATRSDDGATGAITLIVTAGDLTHDHPFTSNGGLVLRATEWTSGGTAANPTLTTLPLNNSTAALIFMADAGTPANFVNISTQWANLTVQWYPQNMLANISQWGTIVTTGVNTNGLVTIKISHTDGREGLITLPVGAGLPPQPPAFEMLLGETANAPHAPLLPTPYLIETGNVVYLGIRTGGSTWENLSGFTLSSSHPAVAAITAGGVVTATGAGTTAIRAVRNSDNAEEIITLTVIQGPEPYRYGFYYHGSLDAPWLNQNNIRRVIHRDGKLFVLSGVPTGVAASAVMPEIRVFDAVSLEYIRTMDKTGIAGGRHIISDIAMTEDGKLLACNKSVITSTALVVPAALANANDQNFRVYIWDTVDAQPRLLYQLNRLGLAHTETQANPTAAQWDSMTEAMQRAVIHNFGNGWYNNALLGTTMTVSGTSDNLIVYLPSFSFDAPNNNIFAGQQWRMAAHVIENGVHTRSQYKRRATSGADLEFISGNNLGGLGFQITMSPLGEHRIIFTRNDNNVSDRAFPAEFYWNWNENWVVGANQFGFDFVSSMPAEFNLLRTSGISFFHAADAARTDRSYMVVPIADAGRVNAGVTLFDITDGLDNAVKISENLFGTMSGNTPAPKMKAFGVVRNGEIYVSVLAENQGFAAFATYEFDDGGTTDIDTPRHQPEVRVFPNPVQDILNIDADFEITSLRLVDLTGRIIMNISGNQRTVDMSNVPAGNYILFVNEIPVRIIKR